jgi:hypothetical protein
MPRGRFRIAFALFVLVGCVAAVEPAAGSSPASSGTPIGSGTGFTLTVTRTGTGTGSVASDDDNIACPSTCSFEYSSATVVDLTATAGPFSKFDSFQGCDSVDSNTCTVTVDADKTVQAKFTTTDPEDPQATMDKPKTTLNLSKSIPLKWHGTDSGGSGIASFDIRARRASFTSGFGPFWNIRSLQHTTTQSATFKGGSGSIYCFSVRARDRAGNVSAFSNEKCTEVPADDRQLHASSGWTRKAHQGGAFLGTLSTAKRRGATLKLSKVKAKRLGFMAKLCSGCGSVQVTFGNLTSNPISLNGSGVLISVFSPFSSVKTGNVTIRVTTANKLVQIDGLVALRTGTVTKGPAANHTFEVRQIL